MNLASLKHYQHCIQICHSKLKILKMYHVCHTASPSSSVPRYSISVLRQEQTVNKLTINHHNRNHGYPEKCCTPCTL